MAYGKLFLIPVPLAENAERASYTSLHAEVINMIDEYIVENEKTARKFLKSAGLKLPQERLTLHDYGKHNREKVDFKQMFAGLCQGKDVGLMSDAGCPGIADPGAAVVAEAHRLGVQVIPLVGPNSILLALMASGFNGQQFAFNGYLPIDKADRTKGIKNLELLSSRTNAAQIFIETPFRNNQMLEELLRTCKSTTKLCVAVNLTAADERIISKPVSDWNKSDIDLHKKPAVFLLQAT